MTLALRLVVTDMHATLRRTIHEVSEGMVFIAENGAYVVRDSQELSSHPIDTGRARAVVRHLRELAGEGVDKEVAVAELQRALGVSPSQTAAFGDMPNDLAMIDAAHHSFAMADGHPEVLARARHRAPSHRDNGVITVLRDLLT